MPEAVSNKPSDFYSCQLKDIAIDAAQVCLSHSDYMTFRNVLETSEETEAARQWITLSKLNRRLKSICKKLRKFIAKNYNITPGD